MKERKTMVLELASILQKLLLNLACIPSHTSRSAFFPLLTSTILYSTAGECLCLRRMQPVGAMVCMKQGELNSPDETAREMKLASTVVS